MLRKVKSTLAEMLAETANCDEAKAFSSLEAPKNEFGDLASKIAFIVAAEVKRNPAEIATEITAKMPKSEFIEKIEATGPYINFYLSEKFYSETAEEITKLKNKFGKAKPSKKKIVVEYFHANTHKGVHIGHIRNASLGEALCRILEFAGNKVIRANFQGDIGPHVAKCLWGFINLYNEKAPQEKRGIWLGKVYAEASQKTEGNEQIENEVKEINTKIYAGDKKLTEIWKKTRQWCLDDFEEFYKEFGLKFDELYFESRTEEIGTKIVKDALAKGIAKEDQGAIVMDLKEDGLGVYVLLTKEGYPLYSTKDIGLAKMKFDKYDPAKSIHIVGREQEFHFKQLFKTLEKIGMEKAAKASYHLIYDLVMLPEGKMSSREGTMVLYEDLKNKLLEITRTEIKKRHCQDGKKILTIFGDDIHQRHEEWDEKQIEETALKIALAAIKFTMVRRENNKILVFDWKQALNLEGDSGPYLQYAYVRTNGIIEKAGKLGKTKGAYKYNKEEKMLLNLLARFPETVQSAATHLSTIILADYLLHVATAFNKFYNTSTVLNAEKEEEKAARLAIVKSTNLVLKNGLNLLGIGCPEKM